MLPSATLALEAATGSRVPYIGLHPYQAYHSGDVSSAGQRWANSRPLPSHRADRRGRKEALKIVDQTGYRRGRGYTLQGLADLLLSQDQLEAAGKTAEEAQAIRRDLREENNLALSNMQMAVIHLEQGRLTEPEPLVRAAIDTFERAKLIESGATATPSLPAFSWRRARSAMLKARLGAPSRFPGTSSIGLRASTPRLPVPG